MTNLATAGQTTIDGSNITTGKIKSSNYREAGANPFSEAGVKIDLTNGLIKSPGFAVDNNGAYIDGRVEAKSGKIGPLSIGNNSKRLSYSGSGATAGNRFRLETGDGSPESLKLSIASTVGGNSIELRLGNGESGINGVPAGVLDGNEWYVKVNAAEWTQSRYINLSTFISKVFEEFG